MYDVAIRLKYLNETLKRIADALEYFVEKDKGKEVEYTWQCVCGRFLTTNEDCACGRPLGHKEYCGREGE